MWNSLVHGLSSCRRAIVYRTSSVRSDKRRHPSQDNTCQAKVLLQSLQKQIVIYAVEFIHSFIHIRLLR